MHENRQWLDDSRFSAFFAPTVIFVYVECPDEQPDSVSIFKIGFLHIQELEIACGKLWNVWKGGKSILRLAVYISIYL